MGLGFGLAFPLGKAVLGDDLGNGVLRARATLSWEFLESENESAIQISNLPPLCHRYNLRHLDM